MSDSARTPVRDVAGARVWIAGASGMVGRALLRKLERESVAEVLAPTSAEVDLRDPHATLSFVREHRPDVAIVAAARVGGIQAHIAAPGTHLYENLMIGANCLEAARVAEVATTVMLGSSAVYPPGVPQPMRPEMVMTGHLEPTHEGYATAKLATLTMARLYATEHGMDTLGLLLTNLYGPGANFDPATAPVVPALIRRLHEAKVSDAPSVEIWGTGAARREFLHVDDLADAIMHLLTFHREPELINVGTGTDVSVRELAGTVGDVVGWGGELVFDATKPEGPPRKLLDVGPLRELGWEPRHTLEDGIRSTYDWFLRQLAT